MIIVKPSWNNRLEFFLYFVFVIFVISYLFRSKERKKKLRVKHIERDDLTDHDFIFQAKTQVFHERVFKLLR